jgi:hypothetical protein
MSISRAIQRLLDPVTRRVKGASFGELLKTLVASIWNVIRYVWMNAELVLGGWIAIWTTLLSFVLFNDGVTPALLLLASGAMNATSAVGLAVPAWALANIFAQRFWDMVQNAVRRAFKKVMDDIRNFFKKVEEELSKIWREIQAFFGRVSRFFRLSMGQEDLEMLQISYQMLALRLDTLGAISPSSEATVAAMKRTAATILKQAEAAYEDRKLLGSSADVSVAADTVHKLQQKLTMQYDLLTQSLTI